MDNNKIGKYIASRRKEKGLTQQELGDKLFVTDKAVSKWERGLSLPDITILEKLADELDTDIYNILQVEKKNNIDIEKTLNDERKKIQKELYKKIIIYIVLNNVMWLTSIAMCYLDCFIDNLNYTFQDFLIIFFELLARITLVIGAISIFPQEPYSNKRVWFYYIIMGGSLTIIDTFIRLAGTLQKLLF